MTTVFGINQGNVTEQEHCIEMIHPIDPNSNRYCIDFQMCGIGHHQCGGRRIWFCTELGMTAYILGYASVVTAGQQQVPNERHL